MPALRSKFHMLRLRQAKTRFDAIPPKSSEYKLPEPTRIAQKLSKIARFPAQNGQIGRLLQRSNNFNILSSENQSRGAAAWPYPTPNPIRGKSKPLAARKTVVGPSCVSGERPEHDWSAESAIIAAIGRRSSVPFIDLSRLCYISRIEGRFAAGFWRILGTNTSFCPLPHSCLHGFSLRLGVAP